MARTVFILGAGASVEGGAPVMKNFLDVARRLHASSGRTDAPWSDERKAHFELAFRTIGALGPIQSKSRLGLLNLEEVLGAIEMGLIVKRVPGANGDELATIRAAIVDVIATTLTEQMEFRGTPSDIDAPAPYGDFAKLLRYLSVDQSPQMDCAVISLNYDLACDMALFKAGLGPIYSLEDESSERAQVLDSVRSTKPIPLLKLHGSLNWIRCRGQCKKVVPWHLRQFRHTAKLWNHDFTGRSTSIRFDVIRHFNRFEHCAANAAGSAPFIATPTWAKAQHHGDLASVWERAARELSSAENVFVVGYSLPTTDDFFRYLMGIGTLGSTLFQRFWVFDPDPKVEARFRKVLGLGALERFQFHQQTFGHAISIIRNEFS